MATEILDIVDTAVKVGIGALISGVTTFYITTKGQEHDLKKLSLTEKVSLLKSAIEYFEDGSSMVQHCYVAYISLRNGNTEISTEKLTVEITESANLVKNARTNFYLAGNKKLGELAQQYWHTISDLKKAIVIKDTKEVENSTSNLNYIKESFLELIPSAIDDLKI